jgi:NAD(P)-dependent dehydrogenase (short-subunit alcohol dehydrogenase family)
MTLLQDLDYTGRRVLVTGAANGFGAAMAQEFATAGATVVMADIEAGTLRDRAAPLGAEAHVFDQADPVSIAALADAVGPIDVLVNNAGVLLARPLLDTGPDDMRRLVDVDFVGAALMMRQFGAGMVQRRAGVILNISSQTAFCGGENRAVYAAAKAALAQLTRGAAVEWGPFGVRVLALAPGRCITRMTTVTTQDGLSGDRGLARVPLGRWGTVEEIAKLTVMLCSPAAGYITGETVIADGGYVLG